MDENGKVAVGIGAGIIIGKINDTLASWTLGGLVAWLILRAPARREAIYSGAGRAAAEAKRGYATIKARAID